MRLARKVLEPAVSAADKAEHAILLDRIHSLKKEVAAAQRQARIEGWRPIELKRIVDPLKADLQFCEGKEALLRGRLIEQKRAVVSLQKRTLKREP